MAAKDAEKAGNTTTDTIEDHIAIDEREARAQREMLINMNTTTTTDLTKYGKHRFDNQPIEGEVVTGENITYGTVWSGTYKGIRPSEWTGESVHVLENGYIGNTPQGIFTILVASAD